MEVLEGHFRESFSRQLPAVVHLVPFVVHNLFNVDQ